MVTPSPVLRRAALLCVVLTFGSFTTTRSATLTVRQDGTGQFTTINAARAVAVTDDIIEVGPGVYPEEVDFSFAVTLVSTEGAAATILDGEDVRRILIFRAGTGSVVEGFTLRRGIQASAGGALRVQLGATATVRNCVFEDNHSSLNGGALICRDPGSRVDVTDCIFDSNGADSFGGVALFIQDGTGSFDRCTFRNNTGAACGGVASEINCALTVTNSLLVGNEGDMGAIYADANTVTITGNTFYANPGWMMARLDGCTGDVSRNLFVGNPTGSGLWLDGGSISRSCNLFWDNAADNPVLAGEVETDPLFCGAATGDFTISIHSPAAPANSPCGQLMGAFPTACDIVAPPPPVVGPVILTITDVPNDQGNQVRVRWERADYDASGEEFVITGYGIYRHQGRFVAGMKLPAGARAGAKSPAIDGWDYIATVPARGDAIYQYVAPTLCNKPVDGDPCYTTFFVSAMTPDPLVYFDSAPDSGFSEDNLPPAAPPLLSVNVSEGGAELVWDAAAGDDVDHYRIYRVKGPAYPLPVAHNLVHSTTELSWFDPVGLPQTHYVMTSVDVNGNQSDPIGAGMTVENDDPIPVEFSLQQNSPNPFNPVTTIRFAVPAGGGLVTIDIFDVAGRRVRGLLNEHRAGGTWTVVWDGRSDRGTGVASGIYFCRLRAPGYQETRRMTLIE